METLKKIIEKQDELIKHLLTDLSGQDYFWLNEKEKLQKELSSLRSQVEQEDFPDIDFRRDIANELSRDELIDRLCEMNESYRKMREEWFNVIHLKGEKIEDVKTVTSTDYPAEQSIPNDYVKTDYTKPVLSVDKITDIKPAEQSDKLTAEEGQKIASWLFERARKEIPDLTWENFYTVDFTLGASWVIDLIGEYASQFVGENVTDMRKELITFLKEYHKSMFVIDLENSKIDYEEVINEYLKTR